MITTEDWKKAGRYYSHRGHGIFFREEGRGPNLVLIHGFPTSSFDWAPIWPELTKRFRVVAMDLIGYGFSAKPTDHEYNVPDQANLVEGLLSELGIKETAILAHDFGDTVSQEMLARFNERENRKDPGQPRYTHITLLNGGLFPEVHRPRLIQKLLIGPLGRFVAKLLNEKTFARNIKQVFGPNTQPSDQVIKDFWNIMVYNDGARNYHKLIRYMAERRANRERWVGALRDAKIPLRLINGPTDPISGRHMAERYRELIPNPDVVLLDEAGHFPQVEDPQGVLRAFLEFAEKNAKTAGARS